MNYLGDFAEDATVYIPFNTFSSDDPSASVTITNLVAADIKVHKDGGTTEIATDGATIAIDFDSITGNHLITVDTSAHSDYAIGSDYMVRIEGTTVDAATINAWVGCFSIENRFTDVTKISGDAAAADTLEASCNSIHYCTAIAGGSTTTVLLTIASSIPAMVTQADQYNGRQILFLDGDLVGVQRQITDYSEDTGTGTITVATFPGSPDSPGVGDKFILF